MPECNVVLRRQTATVPADIKVDWPRKALIDAEESRHHEFPIVDIIALLASLAPVNRAEVDVQQCLIGQIWPIGTEQGVGEVGRETVVDLEIVRVPLLLCRLIKRVVPSGVAAESNGGDAQLCSYCCGAEGTGCYRYQTLIGADIGT